jgi:hypothetical protein
LGISTCATVFAGLSATTSQCEVNNSNQLSITGFGTISGNKVDFSIAGITNPPSEKPSSDFSIQTQTSEGFTIDELKTPFIKVTATASQLLNSAVTPTLKDTGVATTMTFVFRAERLIKLDSKIYIEFPPEVTPPATITTCVGAQDFPNKNIECIFD